MVLRPEDAAAIQRRIATVESRTGAQVVAALVGRCDRYPEARWKAFALGVAFAALAVAVADVARPEWSGPLATLAMLVAVLACGAANALAAHYLPGYARHYVRHNRAEAEAQAYAAELFLRRGLFATPARNAILLLVGRYERAVVVHADAGYDGRVGPRDWREVIAPMRRPLREGASATAFLAGLDALEGVLVRRGFAGGAGGGNALGDAPIEERGA